MKWLGAVLIGPTLWSVVFVGVYGLHGLICGQFGAMGAGGRSVLIGAWLLGGLAFLPLLRLAPKAADDRIDLPRAGLWIGLGATIFTLFPVAVTSSCG